MEKILQQIVRKRDLPVLEREFHKLERELNDCLQTDFALLSETSCHLLRGGGKRLRPALLFLGARFDPEAKRERLLPLAMSLELIHMASLVHDDVVDDALLRRSHPTVKAVWGNEISVYTGDFIVSRAMRLATSYEDRHINNRLIYAASEMCRGEFSQMGQLYDLDDRLPNYLARIKRKTALLLSASCELGAYLAGVEKRIVRALRLYGNALGTAFQIIDDVLDYSPDHGNFGKALGGDVRQGLSTLPLIYAVANSPHRTELCTLFAIRQKTDEQVERIVSIVQESGAVEYAHGLAERYINKAKHYLDSAPAGQTREYFINIADFVLQRDF